MNSERRVQRVRKAIAPPGEARADFRIIADVAHAMGQGAAFSFDSAEAVWNEIRRVWPAGAGISYARLDEGGLQWPCPGEDHPGTDILHVERFPGQELASLALVEQQPTAEVVSDEYPLLLITGRTLHQFNAGTMTLRTKQRELHPSDFLDVSPQDAKHHALEERQLVTVRSRYGSACLPVRITDRMRPGEVFATFHTASTFVNQVTGPLRDGVTGTPEYKVTAVRLEAPMLPDPPEHG